MNPRRLTSARRRKVAEFFRSYYGRSWKLALKAQGYSNSLGNWDALQSQAIQLGFIPQVRLVDPCERIPIGIVEIRSKVKLGPGLERLRIGTLRDKAIHQFFDLSEKRDESLAKWPHSEEYVILFGGPEAEKRRSERTQTKDTGGQTRPRLSLTRSRAKLKKPRGTLSPRRKVLWIDAQLRDRAFEEFRFMLEFLYLRHYPKFEEWET